MIDVYVPRRWWLPPLLFTVALIAVTVIVCQVSDTAREVLAKAIMMIAGALATPFILETSVALVGLTIVIAINQWRLQKEGDGWVYLAQTEPDAASLADGAETPAKRLEAVVLPNPPDQATDLNARLAMVEGFIELGLNQEAREHLNLLSEEEQKDARAQGIRDRLG